MSISIQRLQLKDLTRIADLQQCYAARYPGSTVLQGNTYRLPRFSKLEDYFCVFDASEKIIGYAALHPVLVYEGPANHTHLLWVDVKVDPECVGQERILDQILDYLFAQARDLIGHLPPRPAQMVFQVYPIEVEMTHYLHQCGFVHTESIYQLARDLTLPIQPVLPPPGMEAVPWRMQTVDEQRKYIQGRNQAFPEAVITLDDWQSFMRSPFWEFGACLAIFDSQELAGSILLYWDEEQNQFSSQWVGFTEYIFVLPRWRGLGLATYLVTQGMLYLKKNGLKEAQLEVKAASVGALGLYTRLGYQVKRESWFMEITL